MMMMTVMTITATVLQQEMSALLQERSSSQALSILRLLRWISFVRRKCTVHPCPRRLQVRYRRHRHRLLLHRLSIRLRHQHLPRLRVPLPHWFPQHKSHRLRCPRDPLHCLRVFFVTEMHLFHQFWELRTLIWSFCLKNFS